MQKRHLFFATVLMAGTGVAMAGTAPISELTLSPDITLDLSGTLVGDENAAVDNLAGSVVLESLGAIPANADLTGYHMAPNGDQFLALDITVELPGGVTARPSDVIQISSGVFSIAFDGQAEGIPDGARIDAVGQDGAGNLLLSFDTAIDFTGFIANDEDVVLFDDPSFSLLLDGSAVGIPAAADLDALYYAHEADTFYLSLDISGTAGGIFFSDEDLLVFESGPGIWAMAYDGSAEHPAWIAGDLDAAFASFIAGFLFRDGFEGS